MCCVHAPRGVTLAVPTKRVGTVGYMAPEILLCDSETCARARRENVSLYGKEVDCWAIGVLVYECLFECMPWELSSSSPLSAWVTHMTETGLDFSRASKRNGARRARRKDTISSEAMSFISSCLDMNPRTRITVQQMSSHPWITGRRTTDDADVERHVTGQAIHSEDFTGGGCDIKNTEPAAHDRQPRQTEQNSPVPRRPNILGTIKNSFGTLIQKMIRMIRS